MRDMTLPFDDLPDLPPLAPVETAPVLKRAVAAHRALARLRAAAAALPDQTVLVNALPLLEARASSEIENIVTTTDALFRADALARTDDPAAKEALRYRAALRHGVDAMRDRPLTTNLMRDLCSIVTGVEMDVRATPGAVLRNDRTGDVVYAPPSGAALLRDRLAAWERFAHGADDLDPLVRIALLHYQFEAIHPFPDGNGRTGRILNLLLLLDADLLDSPILYLSGYLLETRADYYRLLRAVTAEGAWEDWVVYVLEGVRSTAEATTAKVQAIRQLMTATSAIVRDAVPAPVAAPLTDVVFARPYCRIGDVVDAGIAQRQRASDHLKALVRAGVLEEHRAHRDRIFLNRALIEALGAPVLRQDR